MRFAAMALIMLASTLARAAGPGTRSATAPAADAFVADAQAAVQQGRLGEFAGTLEPPLRDALEDPSHPDLESFTRRAVFREFGRYFARVKELDDGQRETLAWLAAQPQLLTRLMMLSAVADPPDRVLECVRALRADHRAELEQFADLAAAVCVVWDAPEHFGADEDAKVEGETVAAVFSHFQKNAAGMRVDPRRAPAELLVYVVDVSLTPEELRWAGERYGGRVDVPALFAAVPYDEAAPYDHDPKAAGEQAYWLPNILRRGGSSADQAYFACQVARAAGVPAVVCRGVGSEDGPPVVWTGFATAGARPAWNFTAAKYREFAGWPGEAVDPQTRSMIGEGEVALTATVARTPERERLAARAMVKSADLVKAEDRAALYRRAIELSPSDRGAWLALADLAAAEKFDDAALKPVDELIRKHLSGAGGNAGFATYLRLRMLEGRGTLEFERGARRAADAVPRERTDAAAGALLALADRQRQGKQWKAAAETEFEVLRRFGASPPVALAAVTRLDEALRHLEELPRLAAIEREVFNALPRPNPTKHGAATPYYRVGQKYAAVLNELKEATTAEMVRAKVAGVVQ